VAGRANDDDRKPIIGITSYAQPAKWGAWDLPAALVPLDYVTAVTRAGGRPLLVPPADDGVEETLDALDGIIFSGGADLGPSIYGAEAHAETDPPQTHRDAAEMALLEAALERDIPTLAICRGFQLLNVVRGGDLVQHLPEAVGDEKHREVRGVFSEHPVEVKEGTLLGELLGERQPGVKSSHHQGVGRVGDGLVETAWAEDGTLEGLEDPSRRFALGVLWHPEAGEDRRLFEGLVAEARRYRAGRADAAGADVLAKPSRSS
jgi:putative glutamine amidotransferase